MTVAVVAVVVVVVCGISLALLQLLLIQMTEMIFTHLSHQLVVLSNKSSRVRTTDAFSGELPAYLSLNSRLNGILS